MTEDKKLSGSLQSVFSDNVITVPNILSLLRIVLVVPFSLFFMTDNYLVAAIVMVISGISDCLDGHIARKFNQVSQLGKCLDPIADKITLFAVGICIIFIFPALIPIVFLLIIKDVLMIIGACYLLKSGITPPPAKWYGKVATAAFYVSSVSLVVMHIFNCVNVIVTIIAFSVTALLMMYSIVSYYKIFKELLNNTSKKS